MQLFIFVKASTQWYLLLSTWRWLKGCWSGCGHSNHT